MSPDLLRRAAAKLRETSRPIAHFGTPWIVKPGEGGSWFVLYTEDDLAGLIARTPDYGRMDLADWIALMSTAIAEPLAAWLDGVASVHFREEEDGNAWCGCGADWPCDDATPALNVARAILHTPSPAKPLAVGEGFNVAGPVQARTGPAAPGEASC